MDQPDSNLGTYRNEGIMRELGDYQRAQMKGVDAVAHIHIDAQPENEGTVVTWRAAS
jgi:hypothetical protein